MLSVEVSSMLPSNMNYLYSDSMKCQTRSKSEAFPNELLAYFT